jgi:hypothetical protein
VSTDDLTIYIICRNQSKNDITLTGNDARSMQEILYLFIFHPPMDFNYRAAFLSVYLFARLSSSSSFFFCYRRVCLIMLINERATCEPDEVERRSQKENLLPLL